MAVVLPRRSAAPPPADPAPLERPVPTVASLPSALRDLALREAETLAEDFVNHLDTALQSLVGQARNSAETRVALALGDALRLGQAELLRQFSRAFCERLSPWTQAAGRSLLDLSAAEAPSLEALEDHLHLDRLARVCEHLTGARGPRLRARLDSASRSLGLPALATAFAPATPGACFAAAFRHLGLPAEQRALAYRLVEQQCLPRWPALLDALLRLLDQQALDSSQLQTGKAANTGPDVASPAPLSQSASRVITEGFLPLLASIRRRHGCGSPQDQAALALLNEFAASFAPQARRTTRIDLTLRIGEALQAAGLPDARLHRLLDSLSGHYAEADRPAAPTARPGRTTATLGIAGPLPVPHVEAPPDVTSPDQLARLLRVEQWFRVRDRRSGDDRWLCLAALYPAQDQLSFRASDGAITLGIRASQFVQDLIDGHAEPLQTDSELGRALRGLQANGRRSQIRDAVSS